MARPRGSTKQREIALRIRNGAGKAIGYARVSTVSQGENGHSLDGQKTRLNETARREGLELVDVVVEVASGRKERDGLNEALRRILGGEAGTLIVPKIDRLGRSTIGLLRTVKWAEHEGVSILSVAEGWIVKEGKPVDDMLTGRAWFAEMEAKTISERTREGLAAARAKGIVLGRPALNTELQQRATDLRRRGFTLQEIADLFNVEGRQTSTGANYKPTTVYRMINRVDAGANPVGGYRHRADGRRRTSARQRQGRESS